MSTETLASRRSALLSLPPELRHQIYTHIWQQQEQQKPHSDVHITYRPLYILRQSPQPPNPTAIALLTACRKINAELTSFIYHRPRKFRIRLDNEIPALSASERRACSDIEAFPLHLCQDVVLEVRFSNTRWSVYEEVFMRCLRGVLGKLARSRCLRGFEIDVRWVDSRLRVTSCGTVGGLMEDIRGEVEGGEDDEDMLAVGWRAYAKLEEVFAMAGLL